MKNTSNLFLFLFFLLAITSHAQSFCFASAGSYYEQMYCELQAKGETKTLPPFYQFKRNDQMTQALLLKRPAARIGILLPMPKSNRKPIQAPQANKTELPASQVTPSTDNILPSDQMPPTYRAAVPLIGTVNEGCQFKGEQINCGEQRFKLTGNLRNQRLASDALTANNKMALPVYNGNISDKSAVDAYLAKAYRRYIKQMHTIGLGGVTMTYSKFYFLFFDLQDKGLNFNQRFETMYDFKKG